MCKQLTVIETINLSHKVEVNFTCDYSDDHKISILCDSGVYSIELCGYTTNWLASFSFKKLFCKLVSYSISENVKIDINNFVSALPQFTMYEAVLDVRLSEKLKKANPVPIHPVLALWSPVLDIESSLLCVLSNLGVVQIFEKHTNSYGAEEYINITNMSQKLIDKFQSTWKPTKPSDANANLNTLKQRVEQVSITSFTWGDVYMEEGVLCYTLFMGHLNGSITTWKYKRCTGITEVICTGIFQTDLVNITTMLWMETDDGVFIGNVEGRVAVIFVQNYKESATFNMEIICPMKDDIRVQNIKIIKYKEFTFLLTVKGTCVVVALINEKFELVDEKVVYCGSINITGLEHYEANIILVLSYEGTLTEMKLDSYDSKLNIEIKKLHYKIDTNVYRTHGFFVSPNRVYFGIIACPTCNTTKSSSHHIVVFMLQNVEKKPVSLLLDNPSKSLRHYWDCYEILRVAGLKNRAFPCADYPMILKLNYDALDMYDLKMLLHLSRVTQTVYSRITKDINRNIEPPLIFDIILQLKFAINCMSEWMYDCDKLTKFQMNSLEILDGFLRETIHSKVLLRYKLRKTSIDEIYDILSDAHNLEYPEMPKCIWCCNSINCHPQHYDSRCAISHMQITSTPGYKCHFCKCVIHKELQIALCPYCDIPLYKFELDNQTVEEIKKSVNEEMLHFEDCVDSCDMGVIDINDIEDEALTESVREYDCIHRICPNWDEVSISDFDSDEDAEREDEIDYIFERELAWMKPYAKDDCSTQGSLHSQEILSMEVGESSKTFS